MNKIWMLILSAVLIQSFAAHAMNKQIMLQQYKERKIVIDGAVYPNPACTSFTIKAVAGIGMYGLSIHQLAQGNLTAAAGFAVGGTTFFYTAVKDTRWP